MTCAVSGGGFAEFVEGGLESGGQLVCWAAAPVVEEDHHRAVAGHVVMNGYYVEVILAQRLQHRSYFAFEHGHIAGDRGIFLGADESGPGVEAHARVDDRAML